MKTYSFTVYYLPVLALAAIMVIMKVNQAAAATEAIVELNKNRCFFKHDLGTNVKEYCLAIPPANTVFKFNSPDTKFVFACKREDANKPATAKAVFHSDTTAASDWDAFTKGTNNVQMNVQTKTSGKPTDAGCDMPTPQWLKQPK